jgi:hypothetical protein
MPRLRFENVVDKLLRVARLFAAGQNFLVDLVADNVELVLVAMGRLPIGALLRALAARDAEPAGELGALHRAR